VLFDTLIKQLEEPEIVAVLGHELGHWKMNHTVKNLVVAYAASCQRSGVLVGPLRVANLGCQGVVVRLRRTGKCTCWPCSRGSASS